MAYTVPTNYKYYQASTGTTYSAGSSVADAPSTGDRLYVSGGDNRYMDYRFNQ